MAGIGADDEARPRSILIGAADDELRQLRVTLPAGVRVRPSPEKLLADFDPAATDLVLLVFEGMDTDGFALCRKLRAASGNHPVAILVVGRSGGEDSIAAAFEAGADDWIPRSPEPTLFRSRVQALIRANDRLRDMREQLINMQEAQRIGRVGSWELDPLRGDMHWSAETYRTLGLRPGDEKTNLEIFSVFVHPGDHVSVMSQLSTAAESREHFDLSYRVVLPNGANRYVQLRGEPISGEGPKGLRGTIQDVTEQRESHEEIRHLALYDSLTGLANRRRFTEQLERSIDRARIGHSRMALLYMDLDQFKRINDTLGHSAGDHLLGHVAEVLSEKVRPTDIVSRNVTEENTAEVSRVGGDEFAILLSEINSPEDAGQVATRVLEAVTTPVTFEEHEISTTASVGIAVFPEDGENVETLVKHADIAMYKAKERGRNLHEYFSHTMNQGIERKLAMETHLRHALEGDEFRLVYQPRVALADRRIVGLEALLRWDSAELGPVTPKEFIPAAEETGLIVPIGEWVLETACAQAKSWRIAGHGKIRISVNVSSRQFVHHDIRETVVRVLKDTGLDPHQLELEITESLLLEDDPDTGEMLRELKAMGVGLALDDFGTGYSSVGYLTRLPLDTLKLDRSLVSNVGSDPTAKGIANALISMAHTLNLSVTAEGVDHVDQARFLEQEGCDELQGFLFSAPISPEECEALFAEPDKILAVLEPEVAPEREVTPGTQAKPKPVPPLATPKPRKPAGKREEPRARETAATKLTRSAEGDEGDLPAIRSDSRPRRGRRTKAKSPRKR